MSVKSKVVKLMKKHKTNNPYEIANQRGVRIILENLGSTYGYYNIYKRVQFIHINEKLDETMQRFVCAHELGHAVLHPRENTPFLKNNTFFFTDKLEVEANTFAVELLMTDDQVYSHQDSSLTIYEVASLYGVPKEVCHLKTLHH